MIVGIKDSLKLIGIFIMTCCAVFVCTLFLNYNMDFAGIEEQITNPQYMLLYDALISTGKIVSALAGGCLFVSSGIMLLFYIKNYIDTHKKEMGILKALGYSDLQIAKDFWVFALSVLLGTSAGFGGAFAMMPSFYEQQGKDGLLPEPAVHFHPILAAALIGAPTAAFGLLAVFYACRKLKNPTVDLLKEKIKPPKKLNASKENEGASDAEYPFLRDVRKATLRSKKTLLFFVVFGAFCFSSMMQMSASMDELASEMFAVMLFLIGALLAGTSLLISIATVIHGNTKTISMMRVFGYTSRDCQNAVLGGYRLPAYIGFALGTAYQYGLLKIMVTIVFREWDNVPEYTFDVQACVIVLVSFAVFYEMIMYWYTRRIGQISLKEIMMEA